MVGAAVTVLVSGYGSIGRRHAVNLRAMGHEVIIHDPAVTSGAWVPMLNVGLSLPLVSHVLICSPARVHAEQAIAALGAGKEVFVEKPLACTVPEGDAILAAAAAAGKIVAVGYQWRAHAALSSFRQYLRTLRRPGRIKLLYHGDKSTWPGRCYEDLLLECSHELDALRWLVGAHVSLVDAMLAPRGSAAKLWYDGPGLTATVELDWGAPRARREWIATGPNGTVGWQFDGRDAVDAAQLSATYREEIIAWLAGRPYGTAEDGLLVLQDIARARDLAGATAP